MAAIDGITSAASTASTSSYQVKQTPQVNSVEAVSEASSQNAGAGIASQVMTVKEKDNGNNRSDDKNKQNQENKEVTNEQIRKAVDDINKRMKNTSCQFGIHDATNRVTIKIVDNKSKDVIKEFPAEETLDMIAKAWELAGLMVDEKL